jgi:hypothetical protein
MMLEEGLYAHMNGFAGLAALVGDRNYPLTMPDDVAYPAIRFQRIDTPRVHSRDGYAGLAHPRISVTCFALTPLEAKRVAAQVVAAAWEAQTTLTMGGLPIQGVEVVDEVDLYDSQVKVYYTVVDLIIWYQEEG